MFQSSNGVLGPLQMVLVAQILHEYRQRIEDASGQKKKKRKENCFQVC